MLQRFIVMTVLSCLLGCDGTVTGGDDSVGAGEASLTWDAPLTNADDSPLTDLAGYQVYWGTTSAAYETPVDVGDVTEYTVDGLDSGARYYFSVTAYDTSGNESAFSNEASKDIE